MHVRVAVRVRPLLEPERGTHASTLLRHEGQSSGVVGRNGALVNFAVDYVSVGPQAQEAFFDASGMDTLVGACVDGYHGTVSAYGQTGSGKTYTMDGPPEHRGDGALRMGAAELETGMARRRIKPSNAYIMLRPMTIYWLR